MTCLGAFGGNMLASLLLETPNMVLAEDLVLTVAVGAWALVGGR